MNVDIGVERRTFEARTHSGQRSEVDDSVEMTLGENPFQHFGVANVGAHEAEGGRFRRFLEVAQLQRFGVEGIEGIVADDLASLGEQTIDKGGTDESSGSRDENPLGSAHRAGPRPRLRPEALS